MGIKIIARKMAWRTGSCKIELSFLEMSEVLVDYMTFSHCVLIETLLTHVFAMVHRVREPLCESNFLCIFTPRHTKKWRGIMLYLSNFEYPSVRRPSVSASFPCSNFRIFWPIFFKLCIDIGIGQEWYGIANGLISFWNNRVMALDVCQKWFALRFRALTLVHFYRFSSNFA